MRVPTGVWRAMTHVVAVGSSALLLLVLMAVLPSGLGSVVLLGVIVIVGLLAGSVCQGPAVRLLTGSGRATDAELQVLWTVHDLVQLRVLVCRRPPGTGSPVVFMGRFAVVSAVLVEGLQRGWVSAQEMTALVVHARAYHRVASVRRGEVAIAAVETPWRLVVEVVCWVGRAFAWMPLGRLAWRMRGVVALVCLVQSMTEGRTWTGLLGAAVIALTYLVPAGSRAVGARATAAGDAEAVAAGLGGVLVEVLDRSGRWLPVERRQRLQVPPSSGPSPVTGQVAPGPARHLHLVRS